MNIRSTTLKNGLRVVSDPMTTVETVSLGVWVEVGARYENSKINGISHLLEHMAFKGTKRRSALAIAEEIEAVGGYINAYTTRESTAYYVRMLKEDVALGVELIADILQNSTMEIDELERERTVILQEIFQANDNPDDVIFDNFQETAYPEQALGLQVLGNAKTVGSLKREIIMDFMKKHYNSNTMVLSAAGRVNHDELVKLAQNNFSNLPTGGKTPEQPANYTGGQSIVGRKLEQAHIILGFEGVSYKDPDFHTVAVLSTLLGGGMSSRLFQEIREKHGLAYSIYSFVPSYSDSGLFGIYSGTGEEETNKLIPLVCDEIKKICDNVKADELIRAKAQIKASVLMALESSSTRCEQLARQMMIFGRPVPIEEFVANIQAVNHNTILNTAQRVFSSAPTIAALGPISKMEALENIVQRLN